MSPQTPLRIYKHYEILDLLFEQMPYLFWKDREGRYQGGNANQAINMGFETPRDFIGKTIFEVVRSYELAVMIDKVDNLVMNERKTMVVEDELIINSQKKRYLSQKSPIIDENDQVIGMIGFSVDITELHLEREAAIAESIRLKHTIIEEKMETMRLLAATIAHELRTPLAAIQALSNIVENILPTLLDGYDFALQNKKINKPLRGSQIEMIKHLSEELNQITSSANVFIDMLLAKVNFESMKEKSVQLTRLSMKESVMNALHHYPLDEHSAKLLRCNYKRSFDFMGDEVLFQHIIFNLLKNAIYYVRTAGHSGEISIWFEQQESRNILHFKDTGKGISKENLPNIFNSFYSRTRHGTGIGLAFCKMIVESFGGEIMCDSVEDKYTHFMLSFPKVENIK